MNGIAQGSVAGEWQLTFPTQMFYGLENEKNLRHRRSVSLWIFNFFYEIVLWFLILARWIY